MTPIRLVNDWLASQRLKLSRAGRLSSGALWATFFNWAVVLAGLLMAQGLGAIVSVVVARRVAPINFGQYLACFGISSLIVVVPMMGMDSWLLAQGESDRARIADLWHAALRIRLWSLLIWLISVIGMGLVLPKATYPSELLIPIAIGVGADSVESLCYSGLRLIGQHRWVTVLQSVLAILSLSLALLLPFVSQPIVVFAVGRAILSLIAGLAAIALTRRLLPGSAQSLPPINLFRQSRPFFLADVAVLFYSRASLTLVSLFVGAAATAAFGSADNFINLAFWAPTALYLLVLPIMSRAQASGQRSGFVRLGVGQFAAQALVGFGESVAIFFLAPILIRAVYGGAYSAAIPILQWFSPIPFFKALNFGIGAWLTASGQQARRTIVQIILAIVTSVAGLIAISNWGVAGGAAVEVATEIFLCLAYAGVVLIYRRREHTTLAAR